MGSVTAETNLKDIERHCNNYFNAANDPAGPRDHPPEFLDLVARILDFRNGPKGSRSGIIQESVLGVHQYTLSTGKNGAPQGWYGLFSVDLMPYKRVKIM